MTDRVLPRAYLQIVSSYIPISVRHSNSSENKLTKKKWRSQLYTFGFYEAIKKNHGRPEQMPNGSIVPSLFDMGNSFLRKFEIDSKELDNAFMFYDERIQSTCMKETQFENERTSFDFL